MKITSQADRLKSFFFAIILIFSSQIVAAQSPDAAIRASVDKLFDGMRSGDSAVVRSVFIPQSTVA